MGSRFASKSGQTRLSCIAFGLGPMKSRRILHCLRAPVGGLFRHVRDLANAQTALGYDVGILCDDQSENSLTQAALSELDRTLALGVYCTSMPRQFGIDDVRAYRYTCELARDLDVGLLHGHGAKGGAYARLAARSLTKRREKICSIYTPHGGSLHFSSSTLKGRTFMAMERYLARVGDGIIFESAFAQNVYREKVGDARGLECVIANGLLEHEFQRPILRQDSTDLLFVGELRQLKGVDVLLRALAQLKESVFVSLTIVGEGGEEPALREMCTSFGLDDQVRFVGAMPMAHALEMGRCLVVPSRAESLPYVVLEAAAGEVPLIATDVGGIPEIVAGSDTKLVPADDAPALSAAIHTVVTDWHAAEQRASRLLSLVAQRFTVSVMTSSINAFYEEAFHERATDAQRQNKPQPEEEPQFMVPIVKQRRVV